MDECPHCGAELAPDDESCPGCGVRIEGATASFKAIEEPPGPVYAAEVGVSEVPVLIVRKGVEVGERFYLEQPEVTIGRDPASDIFLNDVTVSRDHAALRIEDGRVTLIDAGSLNGTYVNDSIATETELQSGDSVQIGRFQMVFVSGGGA